MVPSDKKLFLVFEYLDKDLKKYMDSAPAGGISLSLVKVILINISFKFLSLRKSPKRQDSVKGLCISQSDFKLHNVEV